MKIDVQLLIYVYMAVCVSLLLFNFGYILADRIRNRSLCYPKKYVDLLREYAQSVWENQGLTEAQHIRLRKELSSLKGLEKCSYAAELLREEMPDQMEQLARTCTGDFQFLSGLYLKKGEIEKAYFARFVEQHRIGKDEGYDSIKKALVEMTTSHSVYTRENALKALCMMGNAKAIRYSMEAMNRMEIVHYSKLLTDVLLTFQGNKKELAQELWKDRGKLSTDYLLAVMRFIRMSQSGYEAAFLDIVKDEKQNPEIRLEAIRYFRKYRYQPAYGELLKIVKEEGKIDWEYVAVAILSLESYRSSETIKALKSCLTSSNWYVRYNAADILIGSFDVSHSGLSDVFGGQDRYAKEILTYMEQRYHDTASEVKAG